MNYLYQYKQLIRSRKKLQVKRKQDKRNGIYFEDHHIILRCFLKHKPKSVWNGSWNRILLTAREHFIAHMLLWKACKQIYGDNHQHTIKCMYAVNNFTIRKADQNADYKINSRIYEILKKQFSETQSSLMSGKNHHMYGKRGEDTPCYGRTGDKHPMFGKTHSKEVRQRISEAGKNRKHSIETKQILREKNLGKNNPMFGKTYKMSTKRKEKISKARSSLIWKLSFLDGRIEEFKNLTKWCSDNGYYASRVIDVRYNRISKYRDIISVTAE